MLRAALTSSLPIRMFHRKSIPQCGTRALYKERSMNNFMQISRNT